MAIISRINQEESAIGNIDDNIIHRLTCDTPFIVYGIISLALIALPLLQRMPTSLSATLKKLEFMRSPENRVILRVFYEYMLSKYPRSDRHTANMLSLFISLDKFHGLPFTSINTKEQILKFLDHQYVKGKGWVEREHDAQGMYIRTFNHNLGLLREFFRWLYNKDNQPDTDWETPAFMKIKTKKPLRDSPYDNNDICKREDVLMIVEYESELRLLSPCCGI